MLSFRIRKRKESEWAEKSVLFLMRQKEGMQDLRESNFCREGHSEERDKERGQECK
jgi:hypothetical protein